MSEPLGSPWLTIITVVKDAPGDIRATLTSVADQQLTGVEYLVVDGSADREAVPEVLADFPGVPSQLVWQEPSGIYPAMNAGLERASGSYVYFANAGDTLHDADVLTDVSRAVMAAQPAWLFGSVEIIDRAGGRVITPPWDYEAERAVSFSRGLFPCHQGMFARRDLLVGQGGFDPSYSIVADYAAFLKLTLAADPVFLDRVIARFTEGGVSTLRWQESFRQFHRARASILRPSGFAAWRERYESLAQFARVFAYREILRRGRRAS